MIQGEKIALRQVRRVDMPKIMEWENNPENWAVSETERAYTFDEINLLVDSAEDIFENGQFRFIIEQNETKTQIGTLDLFQADFSKKTVHLGILIAIPSQRRNGYAKEAVKLAANYIFERLKMNTIFCLIQAFNQPSLKLFKKCGFEIVKVDPENAIFDSNSSETILLCLCKKK